jgi:hypothetical protein
MAASNSTCRRRGWSWWGCNLEKRPYERRTRKRSRNTVRSEPFDKLRTGCAAEGAKSKRHDTSKIWCFDFAELRSATLNTNEFWFCDRESWKAPVFDAGATKVPDGSGSCRYDERSGGIGRDARIAVA